MKSQIIAISIVLGLTAFMATSLISVGTDKPVAVSPSQT